MWRRRWFCRGGPFWIFGILILGIIIFYQVILILILTFSFHSIVLLIELILFLVFLSKIFWW